MKTTRATLLTWVTIVAVCMADGCSGSKRTDSTPDPQKVTLNVAMASDLQTVFPKLRVTFEQDHPSIHLRPTFAASGTLFAQIRQSAPFDLFLSADLEFPKSLIDSGDAEAPITPYAEGRIVLWARKDSELHIQTLHQAVLQSAQVRKIAIANPRHAPYGRAAQSALEHWRMHESLAPKLVFGENVAQTAQFVQLGDADIGIFSLTLARSTPMESMGDYWLIPETDHQPIEQGGVVLRHAASPEEARQFLQFLISPTGSEILDQAGLSPPKKNETRQKK